MGIDAVVLVLAASLLHAFWNASTHSEGDRPATLAVAYLVGVVWMAPWVVADPPFEVWWLVGLSGLAHAGYLLSLARAYERGSLAVVYPLARGSAPLLVAAAGVWVLDQRPGPLTVVGLVAVAVGLGIVGLVGWHGGDRSAVAIAVVSGCFIAGYTSIDARGASEVSAWSFFASASIVAVLVVMGIDRVGWHRLRSSARAGVVVGLASSGAYAAVLLAYTRADAANVATLRSSSILFGLVFARQMVTRPLLAGVVLTVAGTVAVAL